MAQVTEKPLLSIKEVVWAVGIASAFILQTSRLESKFEQYIALNNADKKIIDLQLIALNKQDVIHTQDIKELSQRILEVYATKPEEPKIETKRR